jgi:hypothetical protein
MRRLSNPLTASEEKSHREALAIVKGIRYNSIMADTKNTAGKGAVSNTPNATATRKRRVSTVDPNETKAAKFKRLGGLRVAKAIKAIGLIGNLNGSGYEYTPEQIDKMRTGLNNAVTNTLAKFSSAGTVAKQASFDL